MNAIELCHRVTGLDLPMAQAMIEAHGCTHRITAEGSKLILANITSDFVETRINLRVEQYKVKHARVG